MVMTAVILFALGALGGLVMAVRHFQGHLPPMGLAVVHGLAGAAGLVVLALAYFGAKGAVSGLGLPLLLFVVAALGGFALFSNHLKGKALPTPVVVIHALVAVTAFALLLVAL